MRFPRVATDADDTAAGRQLARGFAMLRFARDLEHGFERAFGARYDWLIALSYAIAWLGATALALTSRALPAAVLATVLVPIGFLLRGLLWRRRAALALAGLAMFWITVFARTRGLDASLETFAWSQGGVLLVAAVLGYLHEHSVRLAYLQSLVITHLGERDGLTAACESAQCSTATSSGSGSSASTDQALLVLLFVDIDNFRKFNDRYGLAGRR